VKYTWIDMIVTTYCSRMCPNCCAQIPTHATMPAAHYDWAYFEHIAPYLHGVIGMAITGGEPTLHPEFPRLAKGFRKLFGLNYFRLDTNGFNVFKYADLMSCFDAIKITDYGEPVSRGAIDWVNEHCPDKLIVHSGDHTPLTQFGGGKPCRTVAHEAVYANGRLYPCCGAWGIVGAQSLVPVDNWQDLLDDVPRPCAGCVFSQREG
jgi:hypothetical protein